jgi:hypothetical protein
MVGTGIRWLLGGIVLGQVAPKVLASDAAKKVYVQGIAAGMRAKAAYLDLVEQARAEVGDMVAEATYLNTKEADTVASE